MVVLAKKPKVTDKDKAPKEEKTEGVKDGVSK
jgi:hypothetical protein